MFYWRKEKTASWWAVVCAIHRGADGRIYANADFRKAGGTDGY
jgi:hypothetical protein